MSDLNKLREDLVNCSYVIRRDFTYKGRRIAIAAVDSATRNRVISGVAQETWDSNRDGICEIVSAALAERKRNIRRKERGWILNGLMGQSTGIASVGEDGNAYQLTCRVPATVWARIREHMYYANSEEDVEGLEDFGGRARGWFTGNNKEVQRIITEEAEKAADDEDRAEVARLRTEEEEARVREEERKKLAAVLLENCAIVDGAAKNAKYLEVKAYVPKGLEVQDPRDPRNIYGGGHWWVIESNRILDVLNNGMDGDNWSENNIRTGGAGAVGCEFPRTQKVVEALEFIAAHKEAITVPGDYASGFARKLESMTGVKVTVA